MLNYITLGQGSEIVLVLHGWKMDHSCYDGMHIALDTEKYTYIFIDQRGYGLSKDQMGEFSIVQIATDVISLADAMKWKEFHIIGHSMGGKVLCRLLADIPQRLKSAFGVTPCPPVQIPFDDEGWKLFSGASIDKAAREQVFRLSTGNRLTATWYSSITKQSMESSTSQAFSDYLEAWVKYECYQDITGCSVPLKIAAGQYDPHLTFELMQQTYGSFFPHAEIVELSNCGHYPMYEIPLALAAEWEEFIGRHSAD